MDRIDQVYTIKVEAILRHDQSIKSTKYIEVLFEKTPLTVFIKGKNRMVNYKDSLKLEGVVKDLDL